jgi:hypothetical protein
VLRSRSPGGADELERDGCEATETASSGTPASAPDTTNMSGAGNAPPDGFAATEPAVADKTNPQMAVEPSMTSVDRFFITSPVL